MVGRRRDGTEFPVEISLAPVKSRRRPLLIATIVDITARTNLKEQLERHAELRRHADELEQVGREMSLLAQMGELLESCQSLEEAYAVVARVAEPLFAGDAGAVYAVASSGAAVEAVAAWGSPPPKRTVFHPTDCWALRRGRLHVVRDGDPELRCPHVDEPTAAGLLCEPLVAQTETLGLPSPGLPPGGGQGTSVRARRSDRPGRDTRQAACPRPANIRLRGRPGAVRAIC
jgi:hypothetical protein